MTDYSARDYMTVSAPRVPQGHLVRTGQGGHLFVADGSRLFDADDSLFEALESEMNGGGSGLDDLLSRAGLGGAPLIDDTPLVAPPLHALSLAIAQKCNLGCSYCYAQQGEFGGPARNMTADVAERAVDLLVEGAQAGDRVNLAFLGGEPLVNRTVLRATTLHAVERARRRGVRSRFRSPPTARCSPRRTRSSSRPTALP
jgi:uncharacterized protein